MSKYGNFKPKSMPALKFKGAYSIHHHTTSTGNKYILVKNAKVLIYRDVPLVNPKDTFDDILDEMISSYEYNAKRDLELLRAKVQKAEAHIAEILEVYSEKG